MTGGHDRHGGAAGGETAAHPLPRRAALSAPLAALLPVPLAAAPPDGRGQGHGAQGQGAQGRGGPQQANPPGPAPFTAAEIAAVRAWFAARPEFRGQPLPPGIARNLARGKPLPPGIARRAAPPDLVALLARRSGVEYLIIGGALVLVGQAGGIVADLIENALRP